MAEVDFNIECWYAAGCGLKRERCQKICPRYLEMNYMIVNCGMPDATPYIKDFIYRQATLGTLCPSTSSGHVADPLSKRRFTGA